MTLRILTVIPASALLACAGLGTVHQDGLCIRSTSDPKVTLRIAGAFVPLPPLPIQLEATDVDRRVFVDADRDRAVRRLVIVHFERARSGASFKFVYLPKPPYQFGGETYRIGTYVYDDAREAARAPSKESAQTRAAVSQQGYVLPRLLRTVRLARVADADGASEIIIFYMENADHDYPEGVLKGADQDGDLVLTSPDSDRLLARMAAAIFAESP